MQSLQQYQCRTSKSQDNGHLGHQVVKDMKSQKRDRESYRAPEGTRGLAGYNYLVVRRHIEGHKPLQENFRGLVVAKEGISINIVAGSGVKQLKQSKESQNRTASRRDVDTQIAPSRRRSPASSEKPRIAGKEQQGNGEHSTFPSPWSSSLWNKRPRPSAQCLHRPLPSRGAGAGRIQLAGLGQGAARDYPGDVEAIQAQQVVQPLLHGVSGGVSDGLLQGDLMQGSRCSRKHTYMMRRIVRYVSSKRARQMFYSLCHRPR